MTEASDSIVEQVYEKLKAMTIQYRFMPGERLNEGILAKSLGVSRTPLREALTRLFAEELVLFVPGKGFFCRRLDVQEVFSLYELRKAVEVEALRLAVTRAKDEDIDALLAFLNDTGPEPGDRSVDDLVKLDETFHEGLMRMAGNAEMLRVLKNVNARIRFVRWIDMEGCDRSLSQQTHREILLGLKARDLERCLPLLSHHINRRMEDIAAALKEGYAQIYMNTSQALA
ncbi:MAG TPA: GntR family transcriptional regulator [Burkholderiaceae bacterium]